MSRLTKALAAAAVAALSFAGVTACGNPVPPFVAGANVCQAHVDWWSGSMLPGNTPQAYTLIKCGPQPAYLANDEMTFKVWRTREVEDGPRKILVDIEPAAFIGNKATSGSYEITPGSPAFMNNWLQCTTGTFAYQPVSYISLPWYIGTSPGLGPVRFINCAGRAIVRVLTPVTAQTPVQPSFTASAAQHKQNYDAGVAKLNSLTSLLTP